MILIGLVSGKMQKKILRLSYKMVVAATTAIIASNVAAEETIIQREEIPFERCLNVITTSENKLSIVPKIEDFEDNKRVAIFQLSDGILTITCDKEAGSVVVSTNTN